jgi:hypothetical protein
VSRLGLWLILLSLTAQAEPTRVKVGVFLRNAEAINLEQNAYNLSFTFWLKWNGESDAVKNLKFVNVLDGWALTQVPVYDEPQTLPDGSRYQRFLVEGRFFNKFRLEAFPFDKQQLVLDLEELKADSTQLVLDVDEASAAREGLTLPGWHVGPILQEAGATAYPTGLAQPGQFSKYRFALNIERPWSLFALTLAPPLLLVLLCCWLVFFLRAHHVDARVGTVITALLTIVFLDLAYTEDVPYLAGVVLIDQVFNLGYVVLAAMLLCCVAVVRWKDRAVELLAQTSGDEVQRASRIAQAQELEEKITRLDRLAIRAFPPLYVVGCGLLIWLRR